MRRTRTRTREALAHELLYTWRKKDKPIRAAWMVWLRDFCGKDKKENKPGGDGLSSSLCASPAFLNLCVELLLPFLCFDPGITRTGVCPWGRDGRRLPRSESMFATPSTLSGTLQRFDSQRETNYIGSSRWFFRVSHFRRERRSQKRSCRSGEDWGRVKESKRSGHKCFRQCANARCRLQGARCCTTVRACESGSRRRLLG